MKVKTVKARTPKRCDAERDYTWARACSSIRVGDEYVRATWFPHEHGLDLDPDDFTEWTDEDRPVTAHLCKTCARGYLFDPIITEGGQEGHS